MRPHLTVFLVLTTGCFSNWNGDEFPNPFQSTPHWRDCDGDGWGDASLEPECIDINTVDDPDCPTSPPGVIQSWVPNGADCDDAAENSGAQVGMACPGDYQAGLQTSLTYGSSSLIEREYLFWHDEPQSALEATEICQSWWTNPLRLGTEGYYTSVDQLGGLASMTLAERGLVADLARAFLNANDLETPWNVWVDVRLAEPSNTDPTWVWASECPVGIENCPDAAEVLADTWCSGSPPLPTDVFPLYVENPEQMEQAIQMFSSTRVVMQVTDQGECLMAPTDPAICPTGQGCNRYDFICERPEPKANCTQDAEQFDPTCANVLELSDLTCNVAAG